MIRYFLSNLCVIICFCFFLLTSPNEKKNASVIELHSANPSSGVRIEKVPGADAETDEWYICKFTTQQVLRYSILETTS